MEIVKWAVAEVDRLRAIADLAAAFVAAHDQVASDEEYERRWIALRDAVQGSN